MTRRLIEDFLPIKELSQEARREKAIRHGHISTLHVWWARRPLVVARAAVFGALVPTPETEEERERMKGFVIRLCKWETRDLEEMESPDLKRAREMIRQANGSEAPRVLDSMAGGGSIPLEALRLGCEAHAIEYNPVAYLILKATLEYPQKYGKRLAEDVCRWGEWVLKRAKAELSEFYPPGPNGETVVAYIWSRTVKCPSPGCGAEIPLFRQFWLARKSNKRVALHPVVDQVSKQVEFEVLQGEELKRAMAQGFDPSQGTVRRANAVCPVCGAAARADYIREEAEAHRLGHRLIALVTTQGRGSGRNYWIAREEDQLAFEKAAQRLEELKQEPSPWPNGMALVPDEPSPGTIGQGASIRPTYGLTQWGNYFNPRQALALVTFGKWVREAYREILQETNDPDYAKAVATYLAFGIDSTANYSSILSGWDNRTQSLWNTFSGHNLHMAWSYGEGNPLKDEGTGSYLEAAKRSVTAAIGSSSKRPSDSTQIGSATLLSNEDTQFNAVIVDPPYYDNVPYTDLSDFFYVWLKRTVGDLYPEAFKTELVPKDEEIVHNPARWGGGKEGEEISRKHFERLLTQAFREIHRVLKPDGLAVIMFTHKSTAAWEKLIESLLQAGLYPTASWPVHTEMEASTHTREKGSIRSTILLACRKRPTGQTETGWYQEIKPKMEAYLRRRLEEFWQAGIGGVDFFVAGIGPALEIFGRYEKVLTPAGEEVTVERFLDEVRALVADYALEQLFRNGVGEVDAPTRFYLLWRWAFGPGEVLFDEAHKLAIAEGAEIDELVQRGMAKKSKDKVKLLDALERDERSLKREIGGSYPLINGLQTVLRLWRKGDTEGIRAFLEERGLARSETFWRLAQALREVLHENDEERGLLDQFLPTKERLERDLRLPFA
ncbi:MAG: Adenine-specific DNA methylase [Acetothermia bacterium 64_32]|nr:MAG: Adenine-specific DNA methylase [Acetothermia bacterium 64_32]HAF71479.1 DNA methylase [Candidatus Acetothermia bacterium]